MPDKHDAPHMEVTEVGRGCDLPRDGRRDGARCEVPSLGSELALQGQIEVKGYSNEH